MQSTELSDKNGREIFEGDLLKRYGVDEPLQVFWKAPCFVATGAAGVSHWYFDEAEAVEIIGNIYEHPHLLTNEKNKAAVALGRRGGKAKNAKLTEEQRKEMMAEVRKGKASIPRFHTLKVPCPFPGCKITNGHEHII
jgi:YopX protein